MIIYDNIIQGTPEWFRVKLGVPSAGSFDKIVTTKGEPSKQRVKYAERLAGEIVSGIREDTYQSAAMERGVELEAEARECYEFITGNKVDQVGFCKTDIAGCSPDGLIGKDGGLEIKCPSMAVHVGYLRGKKLPTDYFQQVHGSLFVTGREFWDFCSYFPGLKPFILRVFPDEGFIKCLERELISFNEELNKIVEEIR